MTSTNESESLGSKEKKCSTEGAGCPFAAGPGCKRYIVAWMTCIGLMCVLAMRCEIGIAMIKLTEPEKVKVALPGILAKTSAPNTTNNKYHWILQREVNWSQETVGLIESAFFAGYMLFSIPGGFLATIFPANRVLGIAVAITCFVNMLIPVMLHQTTSFIPVFIARVIQGLAEGCLYPAVHGIWRFWAPVNERSKLATISFFGMALGPIVGYPFSGVVMDSLGWASAFYIYGIVGLTWVLVWFFLVYGTPGTDPHISPAEREFIESSNSPVTVRPQDIPWKMIFSSSAVWAIIVANVGRNWTFQFSVSGLPTYFYDAFHYPANEIGIHLSMPYILMAILTPIGGQTVDYLIRNTGLGVGAIRRIFNTLGFSVTALCLLIVGFVSQLWLATLLIVLALGFMGIGVSGFAVNHLDIAPAYAGVLMGISNGMGTLSGILAPIAASALTENQTEFGWRDFFILSASVHVATVMFYAIFASGEVQRWAQPSVTQTSEDLPAYGTIPLDKNPILTDQDNNSEAQ